MSGGGQSFFRFSSVHGCSLLSFWWRTLKLLLFLLFCKGKWYFLNIPADIANYRIGQSVWPPLLPQWSITIYAGIVGLWSLWSVGQEGKYLWNRSRSHASTSFSFASHKSLFHLSIKKGTTHISQWLHYPRKRYIPPRLLVLLYSSEMLFDSFTSVWPVLHNTTRNLSKALLWI